MWYWHRELHQYNKKHDNLIIQICPTDSDKGAKQFNGGLFNKWCWSIGYPQAKKKEKRKNEAQTKSHISYKNYSKWTTNKVKYKM